MATALFGILVVLGSLVLLALDVMHLRVLALGHMTLARELSTTFLEPRQQTLVLVSLTSLWAFSFTKTNSRTGPFTSREAWKIIEEEHIFREGCEHWTLRQKGYSCLAFGLTRLQYLLVPYVGVFTRTLAGMLLMYEYLYQLRRTGSREEAMKRVVALRWYSMGIKRFLLIIALLAAAIVLLFPG